MATKKVPKAPATQRERKGAATATKPASRPQKRGAAKSATRAAPADKAGRKAAKAAPKATSAAKAAKAPAAKPDPLPHNAEGDKARHDHEDPRLAGGKGTGPAAGHGDSPARQNYGLLKQKSVGRLDAVKNWFRRGRGR